MITILPTIWHLCPTFKSNVIDNLYECGVDVVALFKIMFLIYISYQPGRTKAIADWQNSG